MKKIWCKYQSYGMGRGRWVPRGSHAGCTVTVFRVPCSVNTRLEIATTKHSQKRGEKFTHKTKHRTSRLYPVLSLRDSLWILARSPRTSPHRCLMPCANRLHALTDKTRNDIEFVNPDSNSDVFESDGSDPTDIY